jgi:hypothetical protein
MLPFGASTSIEADAIDGNRCGIILDDLNIDAYKVSGYFETYARTRLKSYVERNIQTFV